MSCFLEVHEMSRKYVKRLISAQISHNIPYHVIFSLVKVWARHVLIVMGSDLINAYQRHVDDQSHPKDLPTAYIDVYVHNFVKGTEPNVDDVIEDLYIDVIVVLLRIDLLLLLWCYIVT